ncbi:MAG: hypothetical protein EAZ42_05380 [Verrucomicrobia bacterium]|nr:MAG: hypothetical protein EAZ42_05380 [Verrucomicrobiota bacterium]
MLLAILIMTLIPLSIRQQLHWRSGEKLISHCLRINERHYPSLLNGAVLSLQRGDNPTGPIRSLEKAIEHYPYRSAAYHKLIQVHQILGNQQLADDLLSIWQAHCAYDPLSARDVEVNKSPISSEE